MELFPLVVEKAQVRRKQKVLVGPVNLTLNGDGTTMVIGPNGAGKTSLLRMLHGIVRLSAGTVRWACSKRQAQKLQAFVFQTPVMLRRSVRDNLVYPLRLGGVPKAKARAQAAHWAGRIGLTEVFSRQATALSAGEKQKLALARALILKPQVLFLDEPCASLDGAAMREIEELLRGAIAGGTRLIMSTHDMGQARRMADQVVFMLHGQVHEFSPAARFFSGPQTPKARAFLRGDIVE